MWLLDEVPQALLVLGELARAKVFLDFFLDVEGLFLHLLLHMLLSRVELVLTTGLQVNLVNLPVIEVITKSHHAHLVHHVKTARTVKVQNRVETSWMTVKEVLIVH